MGKEEKRAMKSLA